MRKTYVNALVSDKGNLGIDPAVRQSLRIFYQRNIYIDSIADNPMCSIICDTEDECIRSAADQNFNYLILTWEGNIFNIHQYHQGCIAAINKMEEQTNGDWLVAGHLMDQYQNRILYKDPNADQWKDSFWLFPITAIINIDKWKELGCPAWGIDSGRAVQKVIKAIPSSETIHDNYTPLELSAGTEEVEVKTKKGWNMINASLKAGYKVLNIPVEVRNLQNYLYPENDVKQFNNFWNSVYMMPKLNGQYKRVLESILTSKNPRRINDHTWQCFIRNTEEYFPLRNNLDWSSIDTIALPSSGFKDFIVSMGRDGIKRDNLNVIHFDIIQECTEIKRKMIERWDGKRSTFEETLLGIGGEYRKNPTDAFHMHSMKSVIEAYEHLLPFFDSENALEQAWLKFKSYNHAYIATDMLTDPWPAIKLVQTKNVYICLSDIAGWRNNIISYGCKNLRQDIATCIKALTNKGVDGYLDYKDPASDLQQWQSFTDAIAYLEQPIT